MSLPFKPLQPFEGQFLMLNYVPVLPVCIPEEDDTSDSESGSDSGQSESD